MQGKSTPQSSSSSRQWAVHVAIIYSLVHRSSSCDACHPLRSLIIVRMSRSAADARARVRACVCVCNRRWWWAPYHCTKLIAVLRIGSIIIVRSLHHAARKERAFGQRLGIIHNEGVQWMEQRRFGKRNDDRDDGAGGDAADGDGGAVVEFKGLFNLSLINILWTMTSGERFQRDDARLKHLLDTVECCIRSGHFVRANLPVPAWLLTRAPHFVRRFVGLRNDLFSPLQDVLINSLIN